MADILIRGVPMPVSDFHTTVTIMGNGDVLWFNEKVGTAICLPEKHGKLGDLDALDKFINEREIEANAKEFYIGEAWYKTFRQILKLMKPIVPAERGDEE